MSRKSTLLALAAAATFGLAMLSPTTEATAKGFHAPGGHVSAARMVGPRIGVNRISVNRISVIRRPGIHIHPRWPRPHWHVHYRYPRIWYGVRPVVYGATPLVTTNRCTCLSKEYTQEG